MLAPAEPKPALVLTVIELVGFDMLTDADAPVGPAAAFAVTFPVLSDTA